MQTFPGYWIFTSTPYILHNNFYDSFFEAQQTITFAESNFDSYSAEKHENFSLSSYVTYLYPKCTFVFPFVNYAWFGSLDLMFCLLSIYVTYLYIRYACLFCFSVPFLSILAWLFYNYIPLVSVSGLVSFIALYLSY